MKAHSKNLPRGLRYNSVYLGLGRPVCVRACVCARARRRALLSSPSPSLRHASRETRKHTHTASHTAHAAPIYHPPPPLHSINHFAATFRPGFMKAKDIKSMSFVLLAFIGRVCLFF